MDALKSAATSATETKAAAKVPLQDGQRGMSDYPHCALFNGRRYVFERCVHHVENEGPDIVECKDEEGAVHYATNDKWIEGARRFEAAVAKGDIVTSNSGAVQKISLFRSLFKGRQDVFAHGYRRKDGGIGYTPACANEWKRGVCPKCDNPRSRCADCQMREFLPFSDRVIIEHFKGASEGFKDVVALYPIDANGKTSVLVADFDKEGWEGAVAAYRDAA